MKAAAVKTPPPPKRVVERQLRELGVAAAALSIDALRLARLAELAARRGRVA